MIRNRALTLNSLNADLLVAWTRRSLRARYQQSLLGGAWAVLQPVAQVAILTLVFTRFVPIDTSPVPYAVFSYVAVLPWTFFSTGVTDMVSSLVDNMSLVTKIYFPREIFVFGAVLARLVDFLIASLVLLALMVYFQLPLFSPAWLLLPGVLLVQLTLMAGLGLLGAAIHVFYRDIRYVLLLGLQLWLYLSPVIYPASRIPEDLRDLYYLNPMAGVLTAYREILLHGQLPGQYLLTAALIAVVLFVVGYAVFKRLELQFADVV